MDKTIIKNLESYFRLNSNEQECFVTSDGQIFNIFYRKLAIEHSGTLVNGDILIVSRGTNFEDWYYDYSGKSEEEVKQELEKKKVAKRKWGWWNWLYKILH